MQLGGSGWGGMEGGGSNVLGALPVAMPCVGNDLRSLGAGCSGMLQWGCGTEAVGCPSGHPSPALSPCLADEMNDHQNTLSYVLINPPPDTRLELNDIV